MLSMDIKSTSDKVIRNGLVWNMNVISPDRNLIQCTSFFKTERYVTLMVDSNRCNSAQVYHTVVTYLTHSVLNKLESDLLKCGRRGGKIYGHILRSQPWVANNIRLGDAAMLETREGEGEGKKMGRLKQHSFRQFEESDTRVHKKMKIRVKEENFEGKDYGVQTCHENQHQSNYVFNSLS